MDHRLDTHLEIALVDDALLAWRLMLDKRHNLSVSEYQILCARHDRAVDLLERELHDLSPASL